MKKRVCIIDDDEDVRAVMVYALEFEGFQVTAHDSAVKAIEHLSAISPEEYPGLIIIDYMMPEMNGVEFINLVREKYSQTFGKIPVTLSTARVDLDDPLPTDVKILIKPLDLNDFLSAVKAHFQDWAAAGPSASIAGKMQHSLGKWIEV